VFVFSYAVKLFTVEHTKAISYINNYIYVYAYTQSVFKKQKKKTQSKINN